MGKSVAQKIIEKHIVNGEWKPGEEIAIKIDQTLTQDATGTMAYLQFEALGIPRVKTDLSVSYVDHNTVQIGFENADDHRYLQTVAAKYGIKYSRAGNGICHQVHLERFGKPGTTLLGSDSHTPTGGGVGQIAIGAGGLDVAVAMGGGPFYLSCPKVVKINLTGELQPWVSAKDVILKVLEIFTTKGNVGTVFEYDGPGVKTLSVPERATITNMGAECGVTTSVFPSDETTKIFLEAQGRGGDWSEIIPDDDAQYEKVVDINLSELVPRLATPHSPGNISTVKELEGKEVNQVCVGSCTNSSYVDLMRVAKILEGKKISTNVSFIIAPGSKQVLEMITSNGALGNLLSAGGRLMESACGFCIGNSQSPQTEAVSMRTSNRNFLGRSGTKSAQAFLCSPETAATAALTGKVTDPRDLGMDFPSVVIPEKFHIDDGMILEPSDKPDSITVYRGPNIGDPPRSDPLLDDIKGEITIKVEDKITTDHIIPAGARMKYRSNVPKYSEYVFEMLDPEFHLRAGKIRDGGEHNIILGGLSYGQGSSREHAAICPMYLGVKVVVAKSFERIHTANLINFGIVPLIIDDDGYSKIEQGDKIEISKLKDALQSGGDIVLKNTTKGVDIPLSHTLSKRDIDVILVGGKLPHTKENM